MEATTSRERELSQKSLRGNTEDKLTQGYLHSEDWHLKAILSLLSRHLWIIKSQSSSIPFVFKEEFNINFSSFWIYFWARAQSICNIFKSDKLD